MMLKVALNLLLLLLPMTLVKGQGLLSLSDEVRDLKRTISTLTDTVGALISCSCPGVERITQSPQPPSLDCSDAPLRALPSGVRVIQPTAAAGTSVIVYCDQDTDGGGWTVFQRRQDGSENFYRTWADYSNGFGDVAAEFWLGLAALHNITTRTGRRYELRIDMTKRDDTDGFAVYDNFTIGDASSKYTLAFGALTATTAQGDGLARHNNCPFTTYDQDNDAYETNCAQKFRGAWWHRACHDSNLNGQYYAVGVPNLPFAEGVVWDTFTGDYDSLKFDEMKIRPML